jgi:serine/threonine protein kinase
VDPLREVATLSYGGSMSADDPAKSSAGSTAYVPSQVGPYQLCGRLGEGGMGVVHLGVDGAGREVAVKMLRAHVAHDPEARTRLAREVATLRRVRHPLVADVVDADVNGEQPYVVTRFVPGPALDVVVRDKGPLPAGPLLRLGRGLSGALGAIHAVSVVHRDLKPANVLMLHGDPVLIDFGIAHMADDIRITSTGLVMGTPGYLSPEVISGEPVTEATDWWGWAATLAFAATGRPPFGRGPMDVVIDRVRRGACDLADADERLLPLLLAALSVDPSRRPGAREILLALDRYAVGEAATVTLPPAIAPASAPIMSAPVFPPASPPSGTTQRLLLDPTRRVPQRVGPPSSPAPVHPVPVHPVPVHPVPMQPVPTQPQPIQPQQVQWVPAPQVPAQPVPMSQVPAVIGPPPPQHGPSLGRRPGVVLGLLVVLVGGAVAYPVVAAAVALLGLVLVRTVDRNRTVRQWRRAARGPRRSDGVLAVVGAPWHLVRSTVVTAFVLVLPALLGLAAVSAAATLAPSSRGAGYGSPASLMAGALVGLVTVWWGPGGGPTRRGTRTALRAMVPARAQVAVVLVLMVTGAVLFVTGWQSGGAAQWFSLAPHPPVSAHILH